MIEFHNPSDPPRPSGSCPHCGVTVRFVKAVRRDGNPFDPENASKSKWRDGSFPDIVIGPARCPSCDRLVVTIVCGVDRERLVWPPVVFRGSFPNVPKEIAQNFLEAAAVLSISPNASAALSRRCLQMLLVKNGATASDNLAQQIAKMRNRLPTHVEDYIDKIRSVGNLAAHPGQHFVTAEIVDVDAGEADWLLELLKELFEFFYEKPANARAKQQQIEAKLSQTTRLKS